MGIDGTEQFVTTPEVHSDEAIDGDPLPPGQVWAISPGSMRSVESHSINALNTPSAGSL